MSREWFREQLEDNKAEEHYCNQYISTLLSFWRFIKAAFLDTLAKAVCFKNSARIPTEIFSKFFLQEFRQENQMALALFKNDIQTC